MRVLQQKPMMNTSVYFLHGSDNKLMALYVHVSHRPTIQGSIKDSNARLYQNARWLFEALLWHYSSSDLYTLWAIIASAYDALSHYILSSPPSYVHPDLLYHLLYNSSYTDAIIALLDVFFLSSVFFRVIVFLFIICFFRVIVLITRYVMITTMKINRRLKTQWTFDEVNYHQRVSGKSTASRESLTEDEKIWVSEIRDALSFRKELLNYHCNVL